MNCYKISIIFLCAVICLPLEQFSNGRIEYSTNTTAPYNLGTVATYICNEGFRLDISNGGSETRTCIDDMDNDRQGIFDNQAPQCVRKCSIT